VKIAGRKTNKSYQNRRHFFAATANAMQQILVDRARAKQTAKRGGGMQRKPLTDVADAPARNDLRDLHEALARLKSEYPMRAKLVELRDFAGLTGDQAANALGVSPSTADRHWVVARDWLKNEVGGD
jgi:RNA polymerase sigma factor (TIGR02999 family)